MKNRIKQILLLFIIPITCMIIHPIGFILIPLPIFAIVNSVKEFNYKNSFEEIPYSGYYLILFRKIRSFDTVDGKIYYLYHSSCKHKDLIRLFKKSGIWYKLLNHDCFYNNLSEEKITERLKETYIKSFDKEKSGEHKKSRFDRLDVKYIGTEEEITSMQRNDKLKIILKDESE